VSGCQGVRFLGGVRVSEFIGLKEFWVLNERVYKGFWLTG
jgi:hypothetical protein